MSYLVLFSSAFLSATLLPGSSELLFVLLLDQDHPLWALWLVATLGNTLGSTINWLLGRYFLKYQNRTWFPFKPKKLQAAQRWFARFGKWSLTLSWLPIVGDALSFIAGTLRLNITSFLMLTALGKGVRYAFVVVTFLSFDALS